MRRLNLRSHCVAQKRESLDDNEWWLPDLAGALKMPEMTLYNWVRRGWVKARRQTDSPHYWIIWADETELERLRSHRQRPAGEVLRQRWKGEIPAIAICPQNTETA